MLLEKRARELLHETLETGRQLTPEEAEYIDEAVERRSLGKKLEELGGTIGGPEHTPEGISSTGGPGRRFVQSAGFKSIEDSATRGQRWTTGAVEVSSTPLSMSHKAGTLFEGGQGAGLVPVPQVVPGVVDTLFQPLTVADLLPSRLATTSSVRYVVEGTATSGAAGVAEGGTKPASDLALSTVDEPVKKVATSIVTSDELIDDGASVENYVNSRLSLFVKIEEERQLLRGAGTNELVGIFGRSGLLTYARGTVDNNAVAVLKSAMGLRGSANLDPTGVVMHPSNWLATRLLTDSAGQFLGGGPFQGAYGSPAMTPAGFSGNSLWGLPVALSTHVGVGTALVGSFAQAAEVFRRGGLTVEATNSHSDLFVKDMMAFRAEQRLALCCYRPGAFVQVTGLSS